MPPPSPLPPVPLVLAALEVTPPVPVVEPVLVVVVPVARSDVALHAAMATIKEVAPKLERAVRRR
jgi:hypothetical protein